MHKLITFIVALCCYIPFSSLAVSQEGGDVELHTGNESGDIPRSLDIPLSCYYSGNMNNLFVYSNSITTNATIDVLNTTTGWYSSTNVLVNTMPSIIPLNGSGNYNVAITIQSGVVYYGAFTIM